MGGAGTIVDGGNFSKIFAGANIAHDSLLSGYANAGAKLSPDNKKEIVALILVIYNRLIGAVAPPSALAFKRPPSLLVQSFE
ncbi:hypothetical protein A6U85_10320 [Agrobacterium sp. 13-626]|nr:hypothetical protein CN09_25950 [Rhizobium rhizogenes]OCJ02026.1 hypothetical protein A6U85_10320 [Agrobacterium sp. 13-626]OCJ10634.1 hypothetical protein A6U88_20160 [Agrobacterium sp. B131/95]OCJ15477.1 hypothetical protein A6U89_19725 [Agrobacterium sp. B133/95]